MVEEEGIHTRFVSLTVEVVLVDTNCKVARDQQGDPALRNAILQERKATQSADVLSSMFSAGSMDPTKLPIHPCPPGRKDGTMKTNLMEFQVRFSHLS